MKNHLRISICCCGITLLFAHNGYGQIKGNPQMQGKVQQINVPKSFSKISPQLMDLTQQSRPGLQNNLKPAASTDALKNLMQIKGDKVLVDFTAKDNVEAAKAELEKSGVKITGVYGRVISGFVPVSALTKLETATTIRFAKPSFKPIHQSLNANNLSQCIEGSQSNAPKIVPVISQGDTAQLSYLARKKYHVTGDGVKIGVISDSYDNLGSADVGIKHGELPGKKNPFGYNKPVQVVKDLDSGGTDEGRAMMEIIHDVAPAAGLSFYTAYEGEADFAQGIQTLTDKGAKVITDDIYYYDEPFFQDGIIAQSVDIAKKRGVSYFSSAGNNSIRSYESGYRSSKVEPFGPGSGTAHNFSRRSDEPRYFQPLYIPTGGVIIMSFQWDQSSFASSGVGPESDFDVYLTDIYGNVVSGSFSDNIASGEPVELFGYQNTTTNYTFFLTIVKYSGPDVTRLKYNLYRDALFYLTDPPIPGILAPSLVGHTKASGAISTGAAWYFNTPPYGVDTALVTYYSSEGGVANYYDIYGNRIAPLIRKKPNIVAPDGGNTSFFDPFGNGDITQDSDPYPNFFGTSAAAPHAAGVAALMIDAQKLNTITPDQIKGVLSSTAMDMDDSYTDGFDKGFDYNTGFGFINADKAVNKVRFPNRYINNLRLEPLCSYDPSTKRNWRIVNPNPFNVDVSWFVPGSGENASIIALPGYTTFSTTTIKSRFIPNVAVLSWKDNFEFPRFDAEFSTRAKCDMEEITAANSDQAIANRPGEAAADAVLKLAEVYPNPSAGAFNLYLSLAEHKATSIELYSVDGRKLMSKTVNQSKGVVNIDASSYKPGIYLLRVNQENFNKTIKLVKQ